MTSPAARFTLRVGENAVEYTVTLERCGAESTCYNFEAQAADEIIAGTVAAFEDGVTQWKATHGLKMSFGASRYEAIRELLEDLCAG